MPSAPLTRVSEIKLGFAPGGHPRAELKAEFFEFTRGDARCRRRRIIGDHQCPSSVDIAIQRLDGRSSARLPPSGLEVADVARARRGISVRAGCGGIKDIPCRVVVEDRSDHFSGITGSPRGETITPMALPEGRPTLAVSRSGGIVLVVNQGDLALVVGRFQNDTDILNTLLIG